MRWIGRLIMRAYWRIVGTGYTCDDCKSWTPRGAGKAHVTMEYREVPAVPLPREPVTMPPEGLDARMDGMASSIVAAIRSSRVVQHLFTVLRCPRCADAWAMKRIEKAAKELVWDLRTVVEWAEKMMRANHAAA